MLLLGQVFSLVSGLWFLVSEAKPRQGYRRVNLKVFPYYIAYIIYSEVIWVLAIAHSARRPEYWITRGIPK